MRDPTHARSCRCARCGIPDDAAPVAAILTPREREVAHLVFEDKTDREIGRELGIAENTVKEFLRRIGLKLRSQGASVRRRRAIVDWVTGTR